MLGEAILMRFWDKRISQKRLRWINEEIKNQMESRSFSNTWTVCGHTHSAEIDLENQFVNSGFVRAGLGQYLTINDVGFIELHEEHY
jgi:UDP-2,3-diacylglucosamine pyrophosphatase LpxH